LRKVHRMRIIVRVRGPNLVWREEVLWGQEVCGVEFFWRMASLEKI